jgi:hypothetical protein
VQSFEVAETLYPWLSGNSVEHAKSGRPEGVVDRNMAVVEVLAAIQEGAQAYLQTGKVAEYCNEI